jgi:uncharacterized protein YraI
VQLKNIFLFIAITMLCSGCSGKIILTATPDFVTATLPSTQIPQATQTSVVSTPGAVEESNISLVEGTTTTQINVRATTSTASELLGMIGPFVKVQITGRDASGSWYQIIYADSKTGKGWVRAEYVRVNAPVEIPLVEATLGSGSAVSGLVIQKINVRNGPGTDYELLGVLNSNDVVFITGKNPDGTWMQIEFANSSDGKGWVTTEFLQVGNVETVPVIGKAVIETPTPREVASTPNAIVKLAMQDGDSMQAPLVAANFSATGSCALQVNGDVSSPNGDVEDWVQFTSYGEVVAIEVTCSSDTLRAELWRDGKTVDDFQLSCGDESFVTIASNSGYFLRLSELKVNEPGYTSYVLNVKTIR